MYLRCTKCQIHQTLGNIDWQAALKAATAHDTLHHKRRPTAVFGNNPSMPALSFYTWSPPPAYYWLFGKPNNCRYPQ